MSFNLIDQLTKEDKTKIENYISLYGIERDRFIGIDNWLENWAKNKIKLYKLLNNNMIYRIPFEYNKSENDLQRQIEELCKESSFITKFEDWVHSESSHFIFEEYLNMPPCEWIHPRTICLDRVRFGFKFKLEGKQKTFQIQPGAKPIRAISRFLNYFKELEGVDELIREFEDFRIKHSLILNDKTIKGNLVISIHPLDYMTMSDNDSKWQSCMTWVNDGCYHVGTVEMMNSNNVLCCYIENNKPYNFNDEEIEKVFNPTLTMYYLNSLNTKGIPPRRLLDSNIISNYEQIKNIISLGDYKQILDDIYDNNEIISTLTTNFDLNDEFNRDDIISLLYYFGYLTIKEEEIISTYKFTIPNKVIKTVYSNYYISILKEYNVITESDKETEAIKEILNNGKIDKFCEYVSYLLKMADNRIYINFKEKDLQIMMYAILTKYEQLNAFLEYQSNDNYIDLMILQNKYTNYNIMVELKYLKKSEEGLYNKVYNEALEQINKYILDDRIDKNNLKKYIIVFIGSDYKLSEI